MSSFTSGGGEAENAGVLVLGLPPHCSVGVYAPATQRFASLVPTALRLQLAREWLSSSPRLSAQCSLLATVRGVLSRSAPAPTLVVWFGRCEASHLACPLSVRPLTAEFRFRSTTALVPTAGSSSSLSLSLRSLSRQRRQPLYL